MLKMTMGLLLVASFLGAVSAHAEVGQGSSQNSAVQDLKNSLAADLQDLNEMQGKLFWLKANQVAVTVKDVSQIGASILMRRGALAYASDWQKSSSAGTQLAGQILQYGANGGALLAVMYSTFNAAFDGADMLFGNAESKALNAKIEEQKEKIKAIQAALGN